MLQIQNLSYIIADRVLLNDVQWIINPGKRVALIGPNGAGKTTLLRILAGQLDPTSGTITRPKEYRIGYLPQEEIALENGTVLEIALEGHSEVLQIEAEMQDLQTRISKGQGDEAVHLDRLSGLESQYRVLGGYTLEALAKKVLVGLGFFNDDFNRPLSELSGGWRMRAYLAKLLIQEPDLLLLDEPTNHLDLDSLEWIEAYLKNFSSSMVIVSHDRFFIDRLAQEIAELDRGRFTYYAGSFRFYEQKKALEEEQLFKKYEAQKAEKQRIQQFIDRFRYKNTKAPQVQSRIKMLEKMERIELPKKAKNIRFKIQADTVSFHEVLKIRNLSFRYDSDWVFQDINLNLYRGEKIALVGVNGAGKTTLTRLISADIKNPQKGSITIGERVNIGYYAQHRVEALNMNNSVLSEVAEHAAPSFSPKLRDILGIFQFSGDDVDKPIHVLSGGEKARVSLAKILLSPANFIIMDEPTNHLDLASVKALEHALYDYDGTLLLISHDRYFLDRLVTRVIELRDGALNEFTGNYSDYLRKHSQYEIPVDEHQAEIRNDNSNESGRGRQKKTKDQKRAEAEARQAVSKERTQLTQQIANLEEKIQQLEDEKNEIETRMSDPATYQNQELFANLSKRYNEMRQMIPQLEEQWASCQQRYEEIMAALSGSN